MTDSEQSVQGIVRTPRWQRVSRSLSILLSSKIAMAGLIIVGFWVFVGIFAPYISPYTPAEQDYRAQNAPPSAEHMLGTDDLGRDIWTRLAYGARVVLVILPINENFWILIGTAIWGVLLGLVVGSTLGLIGAYMRGGIDEGVMRILDPMMAFPVILL